jgi:HD-GYP domain-containing protein (c-di-GMP phosphodiesterase class II)
MGTLSKHLSPDSSGTQRWPSRPALNLVVRGLVLAVPIGASVTAGVVLSHLVPAPNGALATLAWYALILIPSLVILVVVDHFARRLLPLAVLLRLSLVFPDRAPSRLAVALNAGNPRRLAAYLRESTGADRTGDIETILTLAAALNAHDRRTRGHSERVRALTELVAVELGLDDVNAEQLRWAGFLHDIGKLRVPPAVLNKRGRLDRREWSAVRWHPIHGEELAQPLAPWLGDWIYAIRDHHEKYDGTGYPMGRAGTAISLGGRIVSVTDSFETMTAVRSYNRPKKPAEAREELARCAGTHFDPGVVRAFLGISIGRLRWTAGLAAWLAQIPLLGVTARAGAQVVTTAAGIESSGSIVGTAALALAGAATPLTPAFVAAAAWSNAVPTAQADAGSAHLRGFPKIDELAASSTGAGGNAVVTTAAIAGLNPSSTASQSPGSSAPASSPGPVSDPAPSGGSPPPTEPSPPPPPPAGGHDHGSPPPDGHGGHGGHDDSSTHASGDGRP